MFAFLASSRSVVNVVFNRCNSAMRVCNASEPSALVLASSRSVVNVVIVLSCSVTVFVRFVNCVVSTTLLSLSAINVVMSFCWVVILILAVPSRPRSCWTVATSLRCTSNKLSMSVCNSCALCYCSSSVGRLSSSPSNSCKSKTRRVNCVIRP